MCTTINDEYSVAEPGKDCSLRYEKVDDLNSMLTYSADVIPVVIDDNVVEEQKVGDVSDLQGLLWMCTVGLIPVWETYESSYRVEIRTPIGVKVGECTRTRREYFGWIPYMFPFAASDVEMKFSPKDELVRRMVAQFKSEWTSEKVAKLNTAEKDRIDAKRKRADALLASQDCAGVIALCAGEKDNRFVDEYKGKVKEAEKKQLADTDNAIARLVSKNEYEKAGKLLFDASAKWNGVEESDTAAWIALREKVQKQKEAFRIANKQKRLEGLMAQRKFEEVVKECASEGEPFSDLKAKAYAAIRKGAEAKIAAIRKDLETRLQPLSVERIAQIRAFAKKSAEKGNINFLGFFVGMSKYDAFALARHYGLDEDQYSIAADGQGSVNGIWISLKGLRHLVKKGNTFQELYRVVEPLIGDMSYDTDSAFNEAFDSSLTAVFSLGLKRLSVPKTKYVRETIDGVVARMFDGAQGGLSIIQMSPKAREPIATESAKLEKRFRDLQAAEYERVLALKKRVLALEIQSNMVSIPGQNYAICKYEVTQAIWGEVMGANPSYFKGPNLPVEKVSWDNCQTFIEKLNALPEVQKSGFTYRLPTEKEWEYACRAGSTGDYCKLADGTEITARTLDEVAWYGDNSGRKTHPVGQKKPNAFGLYDMHGNVDEWCEGFDAWGDARVWRGGGWSDDARDCRSAFRDRYGTSCIRGRNSGFRLCCSVGLRGQGAEQ